MVILVDEIRRPHAGVAPGSCAGDIETKLKSRLPKSLTTLLLLLLVNVPVAFAQQSTTGPIPPAGMDLGLRKVSPNSVVIDGVPAYIWHHGCGPTAVGMVIGYWDSHGYPDMVPGDASTQTIAVNAMIANDGQNTSCGGSGNHYQDYSCPIDNSPNPLQPDRSSTGGAHASNCVADFMRTSWSSVSNYYGWSWSSDIAPSFNNYIAYAAPAYTHSATQYMYNNFSFEDFKARIDAGSPVVFLVDSDGDGATDHFVPAIGYDDATNSYACRNTWDTGIHWYSWHKMTYGNAWGIYSAIVFCIGPPRPAFSAAPDSACSPLTVVFDNQSEGAPTQWHWDFGDGMTSSTKNPTHEYQNSGAYVVSLTATSSCGSAMSYDTVNVVHCSCCYGTTGNVNGDPDDLVDISDLSLMVDFLFNGGSLSTCAEENDIDKSGSTDIADLQRLIDFLFSESPLPTCP